MNTYRNVSFWRKVAIAACAVFACLALALGILAPNFARNSNAGADSTSPATIIQDSASPKHAYTGLSASVVQGAVVYPGVTTAEDFKQNLSVTGTFAGLGQAIALMPEEFTLSLKAGNTMQAIGKNEPIVAEGSTEESATLVVISGEVRAEVSVTIATGEKPVYTGLRIGNASMNTAVLSGVTDDYTAESLKLDGSVLKVYGTTDGSVYELIANRELYNVSLSGELSDASSFPVTVTVSLAADASVSATTQIISVSQAPLLAADFQVNPSYEKIGARYTKTIEGENDENGNPVKFSAFIDSMNRTYVMQNAIVLTVYYAHSAKTVDFTGIDLQNTTATAASGEFVTLGNAQTFTEGDNTIGVQVSRVQYGTSVPASITIPFEATKVIGIRALGVAESQTTALEPNVAVTTPAVQNLLNGKVETRDNSGAWNPLATGYSLEGTLTPTAADLNHMPGDTYLKNVTLIYNADPTVKGTAQFKINYRNVTTVGDIATGDSGPVQKYLSPFDFGQMTVSLKYGSGQARNAYLSDFITEDMSHFEIEYFTSTDCSGAPLNVKAFYNNATTKVGSVRFKFIYDDTHATDWVEFTTDENDYARIYIPVSKYEVPLPAFNTDTINFSSDASKTITFAKDLPDDIFDAMSVTLLHQNGNEVPAEDYAVEREKAAHKFTLSFRKAGIYRVRIAIDERHKDEVEFADAGSSGAERESLSLTYTVQIDKLALNLRVSYASADKVWTYGENPKTPEVTGVTEFGDATYTLRPLSEKPSDDASIPAWTVYTEFKLYYIDTETLNVIDLSQAGQHLNAGKYVVYVSATDTDAYRFSDSPTETLLRAPVVTVNPAKLQSDRLLQDITFDNQKHDPSDFITANGIVTQYDEKDDVVGIVSGSLAVDSASTPVGVVETDGTVLHAGTYSVKLEIKAAAKNNYEWADSETVDADGNVQKSFKIGARSLGLKIDSAWKLNFVYGGEDSSGNGLSAIGTADVKYCSDTGSSNWESSAGSLFFAQIVSGYPKYYAKSEFNTTTGVPNAGATEYDPADFGTWDAGDYVVYYVTESAIEDYRDGDFNLPAAHAEFTVSKKSIAQVSFTQSGSDIYNGSAYEISVTNWNAGKDHSADGGKYILTWAVTGVQFGADGVIGTAEMPLTAEIPDGASTALPVGTAADHANGKFSFLHAGRYTVAVTLNANYRWDSYTDDDSEQVTFEYAVGQKEMSAHEVKTPPTSASDGTTFEWTLGFLFDGADHKPVPDAAKYFTDDALTFAAAGQVKYYAENGTGVLTGSITAAGTYWVELLAWNAAADGGYSRALNFKLPDGGLKVQFAIMPSALDAPQRTAADLSEEYTGTPYTFGADYFNWNDYKFGENGFRLEIYIVRKTETEQAGLIFTAGASDSKGVSVGMTDVSVYTVYVYPAANFEWSAAAKAASGYQASMSVNGTERAGFAYDFEITQKEIGADGIEWGTVSFIYNGAQQLPSPAVKAESLLHKNDTAATVKFDADGIRITNGTSNATNVGSYTATAIKLSGDRAFNYSLASGIDQEVTISQRQIALPELKGGLSSAAYTGENITQQFTMNKPEMASGYTWNWSAVLSASVAGAYRFDGKNFTMDDQGSFSLDTATLTVRNAGVYTVTFTINDSNFCWANAGNTNVFESAEITVNRQEIIAPMLGEEVGGKFVTHRTMEFNSGNALTPSLRFPTSAWSSSDFEITYGSVTGAASPFVYAEMADKPSSLGCYYVRLKIKNADAALNYVWVENTADTENRGLVKEYAKYEYETGNVSIYLNYAITNKILRIEYAVGGYTFGDNGYFAAGAHTTIVLRDKLTMTDTDGVLLPEGGAYHNVKYTQTITFTDSEGRIVGIVQIGQDGAYSLVKQEGENYVAADASDYPDLVNFLPWNAGSYKFSVRLEFDQDDPMGSQLETLVKEGTFEVGRLAIEYEWSAGDASVKSEGSVWKVTYDGIRHGLIASVTNAPSKTAGGAEETVGIVLNYTAENYPLNANTYAFSAVSLSNDNFTLTGSASVGATLEIEKRAIGVAVTTGVAGHVYGNAIDTSAARWNYVAGSLQLIAGDLTDGETGNDTAQKIVTYEVRKSGVVYGGTVNVGDYELVPVLTDFGKTNYELTVTEDHFGNFEVVPRKITVSITGDESQKSHEYREEKADLSNAYSVVWTNKGAGSDADWRVPQDTPNKIFTLSLFSDAENVTDSTWLAVKEGGYSVRLTKTANANYEITVSSAAVSDGDFAELGVYTVTPAALGDVNADGQTKPYRGSEGYPWLSEDDGGGMITVAATAWNAAENPVVWKYAKGSSDTPPAASSAWGNFPAKVADAMSETYYWVKATAPNHADSAPIRVRVEITKAQLTLTVNFTGDHALYYGEKNPATTVTISDGEPLPAGIYSVTGFVGNDEAKWLAYGTINGLSGSFGFTTSMAAGNRNPVGKGYTTAVSSDGFTLDSLNYTFTYQEGALHIRKLPVTVTIKSNSDVNYMSPDYVGKDVSILQNASHVAFEIGSAADGKVSALPDAQTDIAMLRTTAFTLTGDTIAATQGVGVYPLYAVVLSGNYDFTFAVDGAEYSGTVTDGTLTEGQTIGAPAGVIGITQAQNAFTSGFDFHNEKTGESLETVRDLYAWIYGVNGVNGVADGYDAEGDHRITKPATLLGGDRADAIVYTVFYYNGSAWEQLGESSSDIDALFKALLSGGSFNAGVYKVSYILEGTADYGETPEASRYFSIGKRDLYLWTGDSYAYYGEKPDLIASVKVYGLADGDGDGTPDGFNEVLAYSLSAAGYTDAGSPVADYTVSAVAGEPNDKYGNYTVHLNASYTAESSVQENVTGTLHVLPRPIVIRIESQTSRYDYNAASGTSIADGQPGGKQKLTFTAALGSELEYGALTGTPFYGVAAPYNGVYDNAARAVVELRTNAILNASANEIRTQNVGNYPIFALYQDEAAKKNYAITVETVYTGDPDTEAAVKDYFHKGDAAWNFSDIFVSGYHSELAATATVIGAPEGGVYPAGTYTIEKADLRMSSSDLSYRKADGTYQAYADGDTDAMYYDGRSKGYTAQPADEKYSVVINAQYRIAGSGAEDWTADPVNVGRYEYRFVVDNPDFTWNPGGASNPTINIAKRPLRASVQIDGADRVRAAAYNDNSFKYKGAGADNDYTLTYTFGNYVGSEAVNLAQAVSAQRRALNASESAAFGSLSLESTYGGTYAGYVFTLSAKNAGTYTVTLSLGADMENYVFEMGADLKDGAISFTFTILPDTFNVTAKDAWVQYGTPIGNASQQADAQAAALFQGFSLTQKTLDKIAAENAAFAGSFTNAPVFTAPQYDPAKSQAGASGLYVLPGGLWAYNYDVTYNAASGDANGRLTVNRREITVIVNGYDKDDTSTYAWARKIYTGLAQTVDYRAYADKFFAPQDPNSSRKWYGAAAGDASKNYADLFELTLDFGGTSAINAGDYVMTLHVGESNYRATFKNAAGDTIFAGEHGDSNTNMPSFRIEKAQLYVYAGSVGMNGDNKTVSVDREDAASLGKFREFNITYGNTVKLDDRRDSYFTVRYYGWQHDEGNEYEFLGNRNQMQGSLQFRTELVSGKGEENYAAWNSHAGSVYKVIPYGVTFSNYAINVMNADGTWSNETTFMPAEMTVVSRLVTAETEDRNYAESIVSESGVFDRFNYKGGASGRNHAAQIVFKDFGGNELYGINNAGVYYEGGSAVKGTDIKTDGYEVVANATAIAPKIASYSYAYREGTGDAIPNQGPTRVGKYTVTVTLNSESGNYDYKVVSVSDKTGSTPKTSETLNYAVLQRELSLNWTNYGTTEDGRSYYAWDEEKDRGKKVLELPSYIAAIMEPVVIQYRPDKDRAYDLVSVADIAALADGTYHESDNGLTIRVYGTGEYYLVVRLQDGARNNYTFGTDQVTMPSVRFSATAAKFLVLTYSGWQYTPKEVVHPAPEYRLQNVGDGTSSSVQFAYASVDPSKIPDGFANYGNLLTESDPVAAFGAGTFSAFVPRNAGTYMLRAYYPGTEEISSANAYLLFVVTQATVSRPKVESSDPTFTGERLSTRFTYNFTLFDVVYDGVSQTTTDGDGRNNGLIVYQTDRGDYTVTFRLNDTRNYMLVDLDETEGIDSVRYDLANNVATFVWSVAAASDHAVTRFDASVLEALVYGQDYAAPEAEATYGGEIVIEYFADGVWSTRKPVAAGNYKVRAVSPATNNYYAGTEGTRAVGEEFDFEIRRARITVTPSATAVYGTAFDPVGGSQQYALGFAGFVAGETESVLRYADGGVTYRLVETPEKLNAGSYALTLASTKQTLYGTEYDVVTGITADNYDVVVATGEFTVTKKQISVLIGSVNAVYGDPFSLASAQITVYPEGGIVAGDEIADLRIYESLALYDAPASNGSYGAGNYMMRIAADYSNGNYEVTFPVIGAYIVSPLQINVEFTGGGGEYGGAAIAPAYNAQSMVAANGAHAGKNLAEIENIIVPSFRFVYFGTSNDGEWSFTELLATDAAPTRAGNYVAKPIGSVSGNYTLTASNGVEYVISKKVIDAANSGITVKNATYTGGELRPELNANDYEALYEVTPVTYVNVGVWDVTLTLKDFNNYRWATVDGPTRVVSFTIEKGEISFVPTADGKDVSIEGWTYGNAPNAPSTQTQLTNQDSYTYYYSKTGEANADDWTTTVPSAAGIWFVRVEVRPTENYNGATSGAAEFVIEKARLSAPSLTVVAEGESKNDTYTGALLQTVVRGYDNTRTQIVYDYTEGYAATAEGVVLRALNAGAYTVKFRISDASNYRWDEGVALDESGDAVLVWNVARKKIEKPTANTSTFIVNGGMLRYMPVGFDETTMEIAGNEISYGGTFKVTVTLKDPFNFEWADSTTDAIEFDWSVVGWDTIFVIVMSSLGVVAGISAIAIGIQYLVHRRRKRVEAAAEAAAAKEFHETIQARAETNAKEAEAPVAQPSADQAVEPNESSAEQSGEGAEPSAEDVQSEAEPASEQPKKTARKKSAKKSGGEE